MDHSAKSPWAACGQAESCRHYPTHRCCRDPSRLVIEPRLQVLPDILPFLTLYIRPVELIGGSAVIAAGIRFHHACINRETLAFDEAMRHARRHDALEDVAQDVALAKAFKTIDRKRGVMRDPVVEIELAKPSVGKVQLDLLAQTALVSDAVAVPNDEHPDHQFRIDGRAANVAVKGLQLLMQVGEHA